MDVFVMCGGRSTIRQKCAGVRKAFATAKSRVARSGRRTTDELGLMNARRKTEGKNRAARDKQLPPASGFVDSQKSKDTDSESTSIALP